MLCETRLDTMASSQNRATLPGRLTAARRRAGMSREQLAVESGLSWSAITQIEAGRRPNPRAETLGALSAALGVTVEYLLCTSGTSGALLDHYALIYHDVADFVETAGPFLEDGVASGDATLVVTDPENADGLRERLGDAAAGFRFADRQTWYRSPREALIGYRQFATQSLDAGASWVRIIGEPVWAGRTPEEIQTWVRYEALLNLSFAPLPMTLACPYNETALDPTIVANARATHYRCLERGQSTPSRGFGDPAEHFL
jgi:transcriptional regulator with XRE-family HTH domain